MYLECHHFLLLQFLTSKNLKGNQTQKEINVFLKRGGERTLTIRIKHLISRNTYSLQSL